MMTYAQICEEYNTRMRTIDKFLEAVQENYIAVVAEIRHDVMMNESFEEVRAVQKTENVGSYLSVNTSISQKGYVIVTDRIDTWVSVVGTIAVIIACGLILFGIDRWKKRHGNKEGEKKENSEEKDA